MPQLDLATFTPQLFWLAVNIAFLYVMLNWFVLPAILRVAELRAATRSSDLSRAQAMKDEAEAVRCAYEQAMSDARARAQALFSEAEEKAEQSLARSLADLQRNTSAEISQAEARIREQRDRLIASLGEATAELAAEVVEKLTRRRPDAKHAQLAVNTVINEV